MNTPDLMRERLAALVPSHLEIHDDSHLHAGHAGAASGGGHYRLLIVSAQFVAQSRLARQRTVLAQLGDLMQQRIHALSMTTLTPDEYAAQASDAA